MTTTTVANSNPCQTGEPPTELNNVASPPMVTTTVVTDDHIPDQNVELPTESNDDAILPIATTADNDDPVQSQTSWSQSSLCSFAGGLSQSNNTVIYKLSTEQTILKMSETNHQTIMLADDNWKSYISHCPIYHGFGVFICSGKVTTIRAIFDKVKQNSNIKTVIICLSSNNYDAPSAVNLSTNINSALKNKFKNTNIFITLAGICKSLNEKQIEVLESINHVFRNKVSCTIINAPDSFSTTNGHTFTDMTRHNFYKCVTSFLS